jgi:hypothetical protein
MGISVFYAQQISHVASCEYCCSLPGIQHFQDKQTILRLLGSSVLSRQGGHQFLSLLDYQHFRDVAGLLNFLNPDAEVG